MLKEKVAFTSKTDTPVPFREDQLRYSVSGNVEYLNVKLETGELFTLKREDGGEWFVARSSGGKTTNAEVLGRVPGRYRKVVGDDAEYINGWTKEKIKALPKGERPNPEVYLSQWAIEQHKKMFNSQGGGFIAVKSWIEDIATDYIEFPLNKFVMLRSDISEVIAQYRKTKEISIIEDAFGYEIGDLKGLEDEIYIFYVDNKIFDFNMPTGNEIGANKLWESGGKTSGGRKEATISYKSNPDQKINHNKNINNLKTQFEHEKL